MNRLIHNRRYLTLLSWLFVFGIVAVCLLSHAMTAHAFPTTQCAGSRYGSNLGCNAQDVSITGMRVIGDTTSCIGGTNITLDLEVTVNFAEPNRWDIGIFISNDGKDPQLTVAGGGAASCSVGILPISSPFLNLDPGPWGGITDTCGDGNKDIGGGTGSGITYMPNVTVPCQALGGSGGNLYIPFVVSWDNQSSPAGGLCNSIADPVPNTKSKCNAPTIEQGTVSVVVMPTITNTDNRTTISSGETVDYTVVIRNTTGAALSNIVFKDPAVTGINVSGVSCFPADGATCPDSVTVAGMQGAGLTIPSMPADSTVTFFINATLVGTPPDTLTNIASVTVAGKTNSASDTDTIVGAIAILPTSSSKYGSQGILMVYNYILYNFSGSTTTISLSALSNQVPPWTAELSTYSVTLDTGTSANFTLTVQIPSGADIGTVDVTTITATSPGNTATATAVTTVSLPLTLTPDNSGSGGKGSSASYNHRVQNNTASNQTVGFSTVFLDACTGWTKGVYKSDGVTQIPPATVILSPFGGYEDIVVKVTIPSSATAGEVCRVTVTASAGGNTPSATDTTTVKDIVLYSDPGYTKENYTFPTGYFVYAKAFGALATNYRFLWYDSTNALKRTSPPYTGPGILPDTYDIPAGGPLGTWRVEVRRVSDNFLFAQTNFYVGPDHIEASYTGTSVCAGDTATVNLTLHDRLNHTVPKDPFNVVVQGNQLISVTVSGSATIEFTTLTDAVGIGGQTVTGRLSLSGTATVTITCPAHSTITITPNSTTLLGSTATTPDRDESATVAFVIRKARILDWREVIE